MFFNSFYQVQSWVKELKKMLGSDISLVIAGNKVKKINKQCVCEGGEGGRITEIVKSLFSLLLHQVDLEKNRNVDRSTAERYADSVRVRCWNSFPILLCGDDDDDDDYNHDNEDDVFQVGASHIHTSAKLNTGVEQVRSSHGFSKEPLDVRMVRFSKPSVRRCSKLPKENLALQMQGPTMRKSSVMTAIMTAILMTILMTIMMTIK